MTDSNPSPAEPDEPARAEVDRIRRDGVLGAHGRLVDLFEYLASRMAEERSPKEAEIALEVFGKSDTGVGRDDAAVRVYIHRLRKRLEDHYLRSPSPHGRRLAIPKGEYRLVAIRGELPDKAVASSDIQVVPPSAGTPGWPRLAAGIAAAALVLGACGGWLASTLLVHRSEPLLETSVWKGLADADRPLLVVLGDYYMFGEYEDRLFLKRLVRDFSINSKDDLLGQYLSQPGMSERYGDVALSYLPTSAGYALADLAPLIGTASRRDIVLASEMTPDRLKGADILYVGLLSGMGPLKDTVFSQSRFAIGESYDDILDETTGRIYRSEAFLAAPSDSMYRDYAYLASFAGPAGNRISILAGTRDTGLLGLAELLGRRDGLEELSRAADRSADFEALLEVRGQKHVNLETRIVAASPVDSSQIWRGERRTAPVYPQE